LDVLGQPGRSQTFEDAGGFLAPESFDHGSDEFYNVSR